MLKRVIFTTISLVVIFLRFSHLTINPPSLFSDEVDAGYQAYVFNHFGADYYDNKFPTHFHSFADWRTPLIIYSIALSQKIIGYNDLAIRLPSAVFGLLSCLVFYLILRQLRFSFTLSFFGFVLFSLNPIFFHYSRAAWEVSGMVLVFLLGLLFWFKKRPYLAIFFLCLTPYFYATSKLYLLFILASLYLVWRPKLNYRLILFVLIMLLPLSVDTLRGQAGFRFSYINIFTDPITPTTVDFFRSKDQINGPAVASYVFHNKLTEITSKFLGNYLSSFSLEYLFLAGDHQPRQGFGKYGNFLYPDLVLALLGLTLAIHSLRRHPNHKFFLLLLLFAPIPFALTRDSDGPQTTRLIILVPLLIYFIVLGFKLIRQTTLRLLIVLLYLLSFTDFYHYYQFHYRDYAAAAWHTGMKEAVLVANSGYQSLYFSDTFEPFLPFFLYYSPYPKPAAANNLEYIENLYFQGRVLDQKYHFGHLSLDQIIKNPTLFPNTIFVISGWDYRDLQSKEASLDHLKIIHKVTKKYDSQSDFYLFTLI